MHYGRHGTTIDTRLTVIDRIPLESSELFPPSPGKASDVFTHLRWIESRVPARVPCALPPPASPLACARACVNGRGGPCRISKSDKL